MIMPSGIKMSNFFYKKRRKNGENMHEIDLNLTLLTPILILFGGVLGYFSALLRANQKRSNLSFQVESLNQKNQLLIEQLQQTKLEIEKFQQLQNEFINAQKLITELETAQKHERQNFEEKIQLLEKSEMRLKETFQNLSSHALSKNSQEFIEVAKLTFEKIQQGAQQDLSSRQKSIAEFVKPMRESLDKIDTRLNEVEKNRVGAYEGLKSQVEHLLNAQKELRAETVNLVHALKTPQVRGRWGEIQLKRVVEMAGMLAHCDFMEQVHQRDGQGESGPLRPDMVVNLPGGQKVVIDSKAPMSAYLEAMETDDPTTKALKYQAHARLIRQHIKQLSARSYWSQFDPSPEFVVLFLPGEQFFSAALQQDPGLIELGADNKVILSTPTTLIALLRSVAYGWRQEKLTENAREISKLGQTLYDRLADLTGHLSKMGRHLGQTLQSYNQTVGSFEQRVMVSARRFEGLGIDAKKTVETVTPIETREREIVTMEKKISQPSKE
tara:strand:- start:313 stop:1803 length:1491 start_codon:yes stop_codon:yes gene_type:complete